MPPDVRRSTGSGALAALAVVVHHCRQKAGHPIELNA
jgi:hypothetical protein